MARRACRRHEVPARRSRRPRSPARPPRSARALSMKCWSRSIGVVHVVEQRRERLADVPAVEAVPRASRHARDERALDLLLQVEDRVVALARAAPCGSPRTRAASPRASGELRQRRNATGMTRRTRGSSATSGAKASSATQSIAVPGACALTSETSASVCTMSPSEDGPRRAERRSSKPRRIPARAHADARPANVRIASLVAHRDHPRRRPRAGGVPRVGAVRGGDGRGRFGQPR